jgi:hypothetical protein
MHINLSADFRQYRHHQEVKNAHTRGVWQMSLAMIISGSIGAFVLLSGLPVTKWCSGAV